MPGDGKPDVIPRTRRLIGALIGASVTAAATARPAAADCRLERVVEFPVTVENRRPTVAAQINGAGAKFLLDSGAFYSMISSATASDFNLKLTPVRGLRVSGAGGMASTEVTTIRAFTLADQVVHNVEFLVGGSDVGYAGVVGQNFLEKWDVEYDLAHGAVRLFETDGCKQKMLAYWVVPGQPYSTMDINRANPQQPHTTGTVWVNGVKIRAIFDTGASGSVLSLAVAERAGIKTNSPGVTEAGYGTGIGAGSVKVYLATFDSLKIGDGEEIRHARFAFADLHFPDGDMLLGADFFLSHRIFVANSQHRLYLTYNGGPVFDLNTGRDPQSEPATAGVVSPAQAPAAPPPAPVAAADEPTDAAGFARRGAALASRGDIAHALADFDRACELDPSAPDYFYQRGMTHWRNRQADEALRDLDHALALAPDDLQARMSRAELRLARSETAGALEDADAADHAAPPASDVRLVLGRLYEAGNRWDAAVRQFDLWIEHHRADSRFPEALNSRCWARASKGAELDKALADCNAALRHARPGSPFQREVLDSRGLVELRAGRYAQAVADYDAALAVDTKNAGSLYGRGIAKLRAGRVEGGRADLDAATAISPKVGERFAALGLAP